MMQGQFNRFLNEKIILFSWRRVNCTINEFLHYLRFMVIPQCGNHKTKCCIGKNFGSKLFFEPGEIGIVKKTQTQKLKVIC